jgi:hypothetical protein
MTLPALFAITIDKQSKTFIKISVQSGGAEKAATFVRTKLVKKDLPAAYVPLINISTYSPPGEDDLFQIKFRHLRAPPHGQVPPEHEANDWKPPDESKEIKEKLLDPFDEDLAAPKAQKGQPFDFVMVVAILFTILVILGFACIYGIYVIRSKQRKERNDQRRKPQVSVPPMGATPYYPSVQFPQVPEDL